MSPLALHTHFIDGLSLVIADGALDIARVSRLRSVLRDARHTGPGHVVVDLDTVSFLDACAVGVLNQQRARADADGGSLRVVRANGLVRDVLEVSGLARTLAPAGVDDAAPTRPALSCCRPGGAGEPDAEVQDQAGALPNNAVHALLAEARQLAPGDPRREGLRARAIEVALPAARRLALRYYDRGERRDDLNQVAALGLVKAVDGYDPERGHPFSDYAVPTILGELRRHFRDKGWGVQVPRRLQELGLDVRVAADELTRTNGRAPTTGEVAARLGVPEPEVREAFQAGRGYRPRSLSAPVGDGSAQLSDLIGGADPALEHIDDWTSVRTVMARLPHRTQRILTMRFFGNMTQSDIASEVGLSQMHVSRLLAQALAAMRTALQEEKAR